MRNNQQGTINILLIPFILLTVLFIGAVSFGIWAYLGQQDWKNNAQPKIDSAVAVAIANTKSEDQKDFLQQEKKPLRTYNGPSDYGSIKMQYPKTWAGYVPISGSNSASPIDGYFYPYIVPAVTDISKTFALRVQVQTKAYTDALTELSNKQQSGLVQVTSYALPQQPDVIGVKVTGTIQDNKTGTMVILPLRDKTLKIWTDGNDFLNDYNDIILKNFTFSP
ncbi:MAG: hypothetical protein JWM37_608 [Candidatus Saccharibacteria bacterium]|nr:hypothetical protein [Candidatus Saccharibacteria bacterium]